MKPSPARVVNCLPQKNKTYLESLHIGDEVSILTKDKWETGEILSLDFKTVQVLTSSKQTQNYSFKNISELHILKPAHSKKYSRHLEYIRVKNAEHHHFLQNDTINLALKDLAALPLTEQKMRVQKIATSIEEQIKKKYSTEHIGYHFNLNGGVAIDYVEAGGIQARRAADVGVQYGDRHAEIREQTYFFSSPTTSLYDLINMGNMKRLFSHSGRMGDVLNIFHLDHPLYAEALSQNEIKNTGISFIFQESWLSKHHYIGIPYETYIMPPLDLYHYHKWGYTKLSRDQENYLALLQIKFSLELK